MKQVLIRRGRPVVADVPAPVCEPGTVLVRVAHSCISAGTELSGLRAGQTPLWRRALDDPAKVRQVAESVLTRGLGTTRSLVESRLGAGSPVGYSAAGVVLEVGPGVHDLFAGDPVACAGAQSAHHAEVVRVPRNLAVPIPDGVDTAAASTVTLGAIALQGIRRANPTLGESFVVLGLGILGQLTVQLLKANGCRVIGGDPDAARTALALQLGMDLALEPSADQVEQIGRLTDGIGADGVIITAATSSDAVVSTAFRMCRRKGRVVLVGDVGLALNRADMYEKELDFFISTSYGPGRYDRRYEEEGLDYPVGYVRWTENRNMAEYLRLLGKGRVHVEPLIAATYAVDEAPAAYAALESGVPRPLLVLLSYPPHPDGETPARTIANPRPLTGPAGRIRVAIVGAGSFAKGMHLPNLRLLAADLEIRAIASRTGHNAAATAAQYGAAYATTDVDAVLADEEIDLVIIATRHDLHAQLALDALRHGKHVLVEKPLALRQSELDEIVDFFADADGASPILLTGFNRRFSPHARRLAELIADRRGPLLLTYRMNAGYVPLDSWLHGREGGGRNLGEACHIYDLFTFLTGSRIAEVQVVAVRPGEGIYTSRDNFVATMRFEDGSVGSLAYTAMGSPDHPKERLEVFCDGAVLALDDFRRLTVSGRRTAGLSTSAPEKGQKEELQALSRAIRSGGPWPSSLWEQVQATEIALRVESLLGPAD